MNENQKINEVEFLLRNFPENFDKPDDACYEWVGTLRSIVTNHSTKLDIELRMVVDNLFSIYPLQRNGAINKIKVILNEIRSDLKLKSSGNLSVAFEAGKKFDYFDELRKKIELGEKDILIIDNWMDADFVSNYLVCAREGLTIRLLTGKQPNKNLMPAIRALAEQNNIEIKLKFSGGNIHDRLLIVDKKECYSSGASFKDGGKKSPTTITQILDACEAVINTYENFWSNGTDIN